MSITKRYILQQIAKAKIRKAEFSKKLQFSKAMHEQQIIGSLNITLNKLVND